MAANIKFKRTSGTGLPTGLTFAEPAFVLGSAGTTTANQLYVGDNSGGRVWVGAKIENTVTNWTGTEANTLLATQQAIDARITSRITSSGGFTFQGSAGTAQTITPGDIVTFAGGTGISTIGGATDTITFVNTGVLSVNGETGAISAVNAYNGAYNNIQVLYGAGLTSGTPTVNDTTTSWTITNTGVLSLAGLSGSVGLTSGSGIRITTSGNTFTVANTGVLSFNSLTGAITGVSQLSAGSGITLSPVGGTGTQTITNTGVLSFNGSAGSVTGVGSLNGATGTLTGVSLIIPGTGISVSSLGVTGAQTVTNVGVTGLTGTANQITVSGTTGSITLTLPSAITTPGSLTVTGDLTVNGTTTTVNSTVVQVQDPIIAIGGYTGGTAPTVGDVKDRGIVFQYYSGAGATGFFGHDTSATAFTYVPSATLSSEVVSGTPGKAIFGTLDLFAAGGNATLSYSGTGARTFALPDHAGGTILAPAALGTGGFILRANGSSSQPTWIDPTVSGFTAFVATNVAGGTQGSLHYQTALNTTGMLSLGTANFVLTAGSTAPQWTNTNAAGFTSYVSTNVVTTEQSTGTYYLTFTTAASNAAALSVDATATTALSYNVATGTLTAAAVDALIDGGAY